jgi:hypothetical protein
MKQGLWVGPGGRLGLKRMLGLQRAHRALARMRIELYMNTMRNWERL